MEAAPFAARMRPDGNARLLKRSVQRLARQLPPPCERLRHDTPGTRERGVVELELPVPCGGAADHARRQEVEQPADIGGGEKMQGAPHGPGADDRGGRRSRVRCPVRGVRQAQRDGPFAAGVVLRLHGTERGDDVGGRVGCVNGDLLGDQASMCEVDAVTLRGALRRERRLRAMFAAIVGGRPACRETSPPDASPNRRGAMERRVRGERRTELRTGGGGELPSIPVGRSRVRPCTASAGSEWHRERGAFATLPEWTSMPW